MKRIGKFFILISIAVIAFIIYYGYISDRFYPVVDKKFYRSAQLSGVKLQKVIEKYDIRSVINLRGAQDDEDWYQTEKKITQKNNLNLFSIRFESHNLPKYLRLNKLVDLLMNIETPALIHCWRGADRTGMASALVLAIERDLPLSELKHQFSWRYGVFPLRRSIGDLVFSSYEEWLKMTDKTHSLQHLLYWVKNQYMDPDANLEYWIETANGKHFSASFLNEDLKVRISDKIDKIVFSGWAFDANALQHPAEFCIKIGDISSQKVKFKQFRQDVIEYLGFNPQDKKSLKLGWQTKIQSSFIPKGCHQILLTFFRKPNQDIRIPTRNKLCIE